MERPYATSIRFGASAKGVIYHAPRDSIRAMPYRSTYCSGAAPLRLKIRSHACWLSMGEPLSPIAADDSLGTLKDETIRDT
jgi:hypothetical protein